MLYLLLTDPEGPPPWDLSGLVRAICQEDPQAWFGVGGLDAASSILIPPCPVTTFGGALDPSALRGQCPDPVRDLDRLLRLLRVSQPIELLVALSPSSLNRILPIVGQFPIQRVRTFNMHTLWSAAADRTVLAPARPMLPVHHIASQADVTVLRAAPLTAPATPASVGPGGVVGPKATRTNNGVPWVLVSIAALLVILVGSLTVLLWPTNGQQAAITPLAPTASTSPTSDTTPSPTATPSPTPTATPSSETARPDPAISREQWRFAAGQLPTDIRTVCPETHTTATDPDRIKFSAIASEVTSCEFAEEVKNAYAALGPYPGTKQLSVASPVTGKDYTMSCSGGYMVLCTGGTDARVYLF